MPNWWAWGVVWERRVILPTILGLFLGPFGRAAWISHTSFSISQALHHDGILIDHQDRFEGRLGAILTSWKGGAALGPKSFVGTEQAEHRGK